MATYHVIGDDNIVAFTSNSRSRALKFAKQAVDDGLAIGRARRFDVWLFSRRYQVGTDVSHVEGKYTFAVTAHVIDGTRTFLVL